MRTSFQSTSSSSAITIGSMVLMPWPISGFFDMMVTTPSGAMRTKALSSGVSPAAPAALPPSRRRQRRQHRVQQQAAAGRGARLQEGAARGQGGKRRRGGAALGLRCGHDAHGHFASAAFAWASAAFLMRGADARIGAAAADVAAHRRVDVVRRWDGRSSTAARSPT